MFRARLDAVRLVVARLFAASSTVLVAFAIAAPVLESMRVPAAQPIYRLLSFVCHQIPSRSPMILGSNAGLCFRCLALYTALAVGTLLPLDIVTRRLGRIFKGLPHLLVNHSTVVVAGLFILFLLIDGLLPMLGWPPSTNPRRVVTGLLGGWGVASLLLVYRGR
ncbi:MAG: DUF2085 domain-containing protein [Candidatus Rokubacteria bacterium]|nr:DUF2085 domain-containing protein [Candidatus Rokubacteria bacterium]